MPLFPLYELILAANCCWVAFPLPLIVLFTRFIHRRDPAAVRGWVVFLGSLWVVWVLLWWRAGHR